MAAIGQETTGPPITGGSAACGGTIPSTGHARRVGREFCANSPPSGRPSQSRCVIAPTEPASGRRRPLAGSVMHAYCLGCLRDPESRAASQPSSRRGSRPVRGAGAGAPRRIARHRPRDSRWRSPKLAGIVSGPAGAVLRSHRHGPLRLNGMHTSRVAELVPGPAQRPDGPLGGPTESPQVRARDGDPHKKPTYRTALPGTRRHGC